MPVRQPRRNLKATAQAFEAFYYPQLIDRIFELAPHQSLLVLRAVCKSWKHRADSQLVRHVVVKRGRRGRWLTSTPSGHIPRPNWQTTKLLSSVTHVDILQTQFPKAVISVHPSSPTTWLASSHYHVTIALRAQTTDCAYYAIPFSLVGKRLRVIAMDPLSHLGPSLADGSYAGVFNDLLDFLARYLWEASRRPSALPIIIVNLDAWYPLLVNRHGPQELSFFGVPLIVFSLSPPLDEADFACRDHATFRSLLVARVSTRYSGVPGMTSEVVKSLVDIVTFMSLDEYRDEVGEDRLRYETGSLYGHSTTNSTSTGDGETDSEADSDDDANSSGESG